MMNQDETREDMEVPPGGDTSSAANTTTNKPATCSNDLSLESFGCEGFDLGGWMTTVDTENACISTECLTETTNPTEIDPSKDWVRRWLSQQQEKSRTISCDLQEKLRVVEDKRTRREVHERVSEILSDYVDATPQLHVDSTKETFVKGSNVAE